MIIEEPGPTMQQTDVATPPAQPRPRDPQSFTRGDALAWKVVAFTAGGLTLAGITGGIVALVALLNA
ncbi:hypothetical protein [Agrococcus sp. BE272]|uniref:hypothetical protein n=1 Tax=Agrococcus sp. BE272 TaxID=2817727 RepID=UPI00285BC43C|nr:hypothetical protein [Agrococcus sp. BE272]MDR7234815.1 hypothetical protein [Agrococcus sp. BE272]